MGYGLKRPYQPKGGTTIQFDDGVPIAVIGMPVFTHEDIPKTATHEELPKDPFVIYEESDRAWLKGLGLLVKVQKPVVWKTGGVLWMHPDTLDEMRKKGEL